MTTRLRTARAIALFLRLGVAAAILGAATGVIALLVATRVEPAASSIEQTTLTVRAVRALRVPVARVWEGYGTAEARLDADLVAEVAGRVVQRPDPIEPGARVARGDLILRIDPADYALRLASAQRTLDQLRADKAAWDLRRQSLARQVALMEEAADVAQREYQRAKDALEAGGANLQEVEQRLAAASRARSEALALRQQYELMLPERDALLARIAAQEAAVDLAAADLQRTEIRAPFDGLLQRVDPRVGERLAPGAFVARIVDLSVIEVPVALPVSASDAVRPGDPVDLTSDTTPPHTWQGTVARLAPEADPASRTILAFVRIEQDPAGPGPLLRPGTFTVAAVRTDTREDHVVVPRAAVAGSSVFVILPSGRVQRRPVSVAFHADRHTLPDLPADGPFSQWTVIADGLEPGALVAVSNLDQLTPDLPVAVDEQPVLLGARP